MRAFPTGAIGAVATAAALLFVVAILVGLV